MALLQGDFWPATFCDDGATVEIHSMLPRSDRIASCILELERLNQELQSKLRDDFLSILNGISNISFTPTPTLPPTPPSRSSSPIQGASFVTEAYAWLLENIANPYPTLAVKESLARRHSSSLRAINSWFVSARRRVGWAALCRDYFDSCRADALDAARRALVEEDPDRQLPANVIHAFISVKAAAEELYSSTFTKSALASNLDADVPDRGAMSASEQKRGEREEDTGLSKTLGGKSQIKKLVARNCYPSPGQTPSPLPVHVLGETLTGENEGKEDIVPPTLAGCKRRFSSLKEPPTPISESTTRPVKRLRPSTSCCTNNHLPSPATNAEEFLENDQVPRSVSVTHSSTVSKRRKRCISDTETTRLPQRTRGSMVRPRHYDVLDPPPPSTLESERSIDEWFKTNFDTLFALPPPADVAEPGHSTQWEVELFNNYDIPEDLQKFTSPIQDDQTPPADLVALENILQTLESAGFAAHREISQPPTVASVPDPGLQGLSLLPDFPQTIDWTALLDEHSCGVVNDPFFPLSCANSALPEIDLSILQLPQTWSTVAS